MNLVKASIIALFIVTLGIPIMCILGYLIIGLVAGILLNYFNIAGFSMTIIFLIITFIVYTILEENNV